MSAGKYQLIDFGEGRKLESLGGYELDRPCPAALGQRRGQARWSGVDAFFDAGPRQWTFHRPWPESLEIDCGAFAMPVQPTPFGHIGLFPEQRPNWQWLAERVRSGVEIRSTPPLALNLFGYTGASSVALAVAGASVVHVDAARPNVQAAKQSAVAAGVDGSIRFLTDDAAGFVAREIRRGRGYQIIVLDPPAYGHGPSGRAWRLERDLWPLLESCLELLRGPHCHLLVTGHSEQIGHGEVAGWLRRRLGHSVDVEARRSMLCDTAGRELDCGFRVRAQIACDPLVAGSETAKDV